MVNRSGFAKRILDAARHLFSDGDAEAALLPLSAAIERAAKDRFGQGGRAAYKRFIHEALDIITGIGFSGVIFQNLRFGIGTLLDDRGSPIKADATNEAGEPLYSIEQIIYHLVRCGLVHDTEVSAKVRDSGVRSGVIAVRQGILYIPFDAIALGLLVALIAYSDIAGELRGSSLERTAIKGVGILEFCGHPERVRDLVSRA